MGLFAFWGELVGAGLVDEFGDPTLQHTDLGFDLLHPGGVSAIGEHLGALGQQSVHLALEELSLLNLPLTHHCVHRNELTWGLALTVSS